MSTDDPVLMPISIHAPHEGERQRQYQLSQRWQRFQSTLPTRGSDMVAHRRLERDLISIHAPHEGERHFLGYINLWKFGFQSTLPTRGSDWCISSRSQAAPHFNPRSPRGGATGRFNRRNPRADDFNPRSPRGGATARGGNL